MTDALWSRYRATGDADARAQLLDKYLGLVHHAAREFATRTPALELSDLLGAGTLGLMRALDTFDLSRGLAFSTYAMTRIRGSILDDLRARDWTPRSVRAKSRQHAAAVARLERRGENRPIGDGDAVDIIAHVVERSAAEPRLAAIRLALADLVGEPRGAVEQALRQQLDQVDLRVEIGQMVNQRVGLFVDLAGLSTKQLGFDGVEA